VDGGVPGSSTLLLREWRALHKSVRMRCPYVAILALAMLQPRALLAQATATGGPDLASAAPRRIDIRRLRDTVSLLLDRGVRDSAFPGAITVVGTREGVILEQATGRLDWSPSPAPDDHTLWDLASLTKVIALTMQLVEAGRIDLDAPVQRYLPEWTGPHKELVTVRHLLTHSSGLPAWRPLYTEATSPADALRLAMATPLDTLPGIRMVYSDLGAILLGQIVVRVTGIPFDRYASRHLFEPLGMQETMFRPPAALRPRVAPTEVDPWRQRQLRGEVHDENAFALGGVSSHAGLFSSAHDLARFARMMLNGGALDGTRIVSAETIRRFTTVQDSTFSNRALGWEVPSGTNSAGHLMSPSAFGHTGFTGTSIWMDPANDLFIVLLSNRVNPTREHRAITEVRVALADAVLEVVTGAGSAKASRNHEQPR
jgi:CubicO group peptidase (beta-lactamase class C family)